MSNLLLLKNRLRPAAVIKPCPVLIQIAWHLHLRTTLSLQWLTLKRHHYSVITCIGPFRNTTIYSVATLKVGIRLPVTQRPWQAVTIMRHNSLANHQ
jgi:hypothetical protein